MLKKVLLAFLVLSTIIFSDTTDNSRRMNQKQEQELRNEIEAARDRGDYYREGVLVADTLDAEIYLEVLDEGKGNLSKVQLVLILPNVNAIDRNVVRLSKRVHRIRILLLTQKSKYSDLKNRSLEELKEKAVYSRLNKLDNVVVNEIVIDDEMLDEMVENGKNVKNLINSVYREMGIEVGGEKNEKL